MERVNPEHRHLVAAGLMGVFKKIWLMFGQQGWNTF